MGADENPVQQGNRLVVNCRSITGARIAGLLQGSDVEIRDSVITSDVRMLTSAYPNSTLRPQPVRSLTLIDSDIRGSIALTSQDIVLSSYLSTFRLPVILMGGYVRFSDYGSTFHESVTARGVELGEFRLHSSTFHRPVDLEANTFSRGIVAESASFMAGVQLKDSKLSSIRVEHSSFQGIAALDMITVDTYARFYASTFEGPFGLSHSSLGMGLRLLGCRFADVVNLTDLEPTEIVEIRGGIFKDVVDFRRSELIKVLCIGSGASSETTVGAKTCRDLAVDPLRRKSPKGPSEPGLEAFPPTRFEKPVFFDGLRVSVGVLKEVEFYEATHFYRSEFRDVLRIVETSFGGDTDWRLTKLPSTSAASGSLEIDNVRIAKRLDCDWSMFKCGYKPNGLELCEADTLLKNATRETWAEIANALERSGNSRAANEARFQEDSVVVNRGRCWQLFTQVLWGFGFKWLRLLAWISLLIVAFAVIYVRLGRSKYGAVVSTIRPTYKRYWAALLLSVLCLFWLKWQIPRERVAPIPEWPDDLEGKLEKFTNVARIEIWILKPLFVMLLVAVERAWPLLHILINELIGK